MVTTWLREWLGRKTRRALCSHVTLPDLYTQLYGMEPHPEHISNMLADRAVLMALCLQPRPVNENRWWGYRWEGRGGCVSNICFHAFFIFCIFLKFYRPHNLNFIFYIFSDAHSPELPVILCYRGFMYFFKAQTAIVAKAGKRSIKSSQSNPKIQQLRLCFPLEPRVQRFGRLAPSPLTIATGRPW